MKRRKDDPGEARAGPELYRTEEEKVELQARNVLLQYDEVIRLIDAANGTLVLTPEIIKRLHRLAIRDLYVCAGEYRDWPVKIKDSLHKPPAPRYVPGLVEAMCELVNTTPDWDAVQAAAYLLWRLNWIHPFGGGNGRTSRAVAYLVLCVRLGFRLPGRLTIAEQIAGDRERYQAALEDADAAWRADTLDVSRMRTLLEEWLKRQLTSLDEPPRVD